MSTGKNWLDNKLSGLRSRSASPNPNSRPGSRSSSPMPPHGAHPLVRMPSSDTLNQSIHNALGLGDGTEQSKEEIIISLKKANVTLTDRSAEMEATFMNQCNVLAAEIEDQGGALQVKNDEIVKLNANLIQMKMALEEKDSKISNMSNEKSFQKQTIIDLKNQLFQLQNEVEDAEFDKTEESVIHKEKSKEAEQRITQLEKEKANLTHKVDEVCMERDKVKVELAVARKEMQDAQEPAIEINLPSPIAVPVSETSSPYSPTSIGGESATSEIRQNWKQLEDVKEKLEASETMLNEKQSALATLEHKHKATLTHVENLETQIDEINAEKRTQMADQMNLLRSKDDAIQNLHARLETYNEDLTKAEDEIDELTAQIEESNLNEICTNLEEARSDVDKERSINLSLSEKYEALRETVGRLEGETIELRDEGIAKMMTKKDEEIESLQQELDFFRSSIVEEKKSNDKIVSMKASRIHELEDELRKVCKKSGAPSPLVLSRSSSHASQASRDRDGEESIRNLVIDLEQLKQEKEGLEDEYETKLLFRDTELTKLQGVIDNQLRKIVILEDAYKAEISKLTTEISALNQNVLTETHANNQKEKEIISLEKYKAGMAEANINAEQSKNDLLQLQDKYDRDVVEARQDAESYYEGWEMEKHDLQGQKMFELMRKKLSSSNENCAEMKETISMLEEELSGLDDLRVKLEETKMENSDLASEIAKLRGELQRSKEVISNEERKPQDAKPSAAKRAYHLALEKKQKKELSELEKKTKEQIATLRDKLADRDTTISATIKSSVAQEKKMATLQQRVNELETNSANTIGTNGQTAGSDNKIHLLEDMISELKDSKSSLTAQITVLRKQISDSRLEEGTPSLGFGQEINDYKIKLQERDGAIATLVKSSITQEQQITALREEISDTKARNQNRAETVVSSRNNPTWEEYTRLQQESEMFAGQIIELDEEIEDLRQRLHDEQAQANVGSNLTYAVEELTNQVQQQKTLRSDEVKRHGTAVDKLNDELKEQKDLVKRRMDEVGRLQDSVKKMNAELKEEQEARKEQDGEVKNLKSKLKRNSKLARVQDELDEVEESNHKLQHEVRELRRKMRMSVLEAEKVPDMESEISALRESLNKLKIESAQYQVEKFTDMQVQADLKSTREECNALQQNLDRFQEDNSKLEETIKTLQNEEFKLRDEIGEARSAYSDLEQMLNTDVAVGQDKLVLLREEKDAADGKSRHLAEKLRKKIDGLENDIDEQNRIISALTNEVKKLRANNPDSTDTNDVILALTDEVKKLRSKQISNQGEDSDVIKALSDEVRTLHAALNKMQNDSTYEARNIESTVRAEVEDELHSMKHQKEFLAKEVSKLQSLLDNIENTDPRMQELQKKVDQAEKGRTQFEKTMISTYERKLNLMQMNKDLTIDGLRKELTQRRERQKEMEADLLNKIRCLETQKHEVEAELQAKMQHKNAKIKFLEEHLSAHEQVSGHMKEELDQLQSGMETVSVTRRAEVEELQEDLMDVQSKATKYQRAITSLEMKLEEQKFQHRNELTRMKNEIANLESSETPMMRDVANERDRVVSNEYRQQIEGLRSRLNHVQEENVLLRHKIEKEGENRLSKNDKWRNSALQEQVMKLQQKLREYEGDSESVRSGSSRISSRTMRSESSPKIPRTPSYHRNGRDDISTHTEMTF